MKKILLAYGNGGKENRELIQQTIFGYLKNEWLEQAEDATAIGRGDFVMTTDSYTVSPIFFSRRRHRQAGSLRDLQRSGHDGRQTPLPLPLIYHRRGV